VLLVEVVEELFGRDPDQPRVPEVVPCLLQYFDHNVIVVKLKNVHMKAVVCLKEPLKVRFPAGAGLEQLPHFIVQQDHLGNVVGLYKGQRPFRKRNFEQGFYLLQFAELLLGYPRYFPAGPRYVLYQPLLLKL